MNLDASGDDASGDEMDIGKIEECMSDSLDIDNDNSSDGIEGDAFLELETNEISDHVKEREGGKCPPGFLDCDGDPKNGCEIDSFNDPDNCKACGRSCRDAFPNALGDCVGGKCIQRDCLPGYADLDPDKPGCDYKCTKREPPVEICNRLDDDCDGVIDGVCTTGEHCVENADCIQNLFCTTQYFDTSEEGGICTGFCYSTGEACPAGFACNSLTKSDGMGYCESFGQGENNLGDSCTSWKDCNSTWCIPFGSANTKKCSDRCSSPRHCKRLEQGSSLSCSLFKVKYSDKYMYTGLCESVDEQGSPIGGSCGTGKPCSEGMCLAIGDAQPICAGFCCSSSECAAGQVCRLALSSAPDFPDAYLRACITPANKDYNSSTRAEGGAFCLSDRDCASLICDPGIGSRCLDFCCVDQDCAEGTKCLPAFVDEEGKSYGLLCLPLDQALDGRSISGVTPVPARPLRLLELLSKNARIPIVRTLDNLIGDKLFH
ncbi:MAG: hypothetical protein GXP49_14250 [Deltaproteobacteria bacterium]|nr:hypothetical protein [Deltaproteobacteria bacterium]